MDISGHINGSYVHINGIIRTYKQGKKIFEIIKNGGVCNLPRKKESRLKMLSVSESGMFQMCESNNKSLSSRVSLCTMEVPIVPRRQCGNNYQSQKP